MIKVREVYGFNEQGIRQNNEDSIRAAEKSVEEQRFFVVCDGMGGHGHGEVASRIVAESFQRSLQTDDDREIRADELQQMLDDSIAHLNQEYAPDDEKKMGTTVVVAMVNHDHILVGHVGDSRCYLFRDGDIVFRTTDHSVVAEGVAAGILTEEEARNHPKRNIITRCVQPFPRNPVRIEVDRIEDVRQGDFLLLCTDGVTDALDDRALSSIFALEMSLSEKKELLESSCAAHSKDNYSGFLIRLERTGIEPITEMEYPVGASAESENRFAPDEECDSKAADSIGSAICPSCGKETSDRHLFCPHCGATKKVNDAFEDDRATGTDSGKHRSPFRSDYFGGMDDRASQPDCCANCPIGRFFDKLATCNHRIRKFLDWLNK